MGYGSISAKTCKNSLFGGWTSTNTSYFRCSLGKQGFDSPFNHRWPRPPRGTIKWCESWGQWSGDRSIQCQFCRPACRERGSGSFSRDRSQNVNVVTCCDSLWFGQVVITMFYRSWCGHCSLLVRQGPYLKHSRMSPVWGSPEMGDNPQRPKGTI